MDPSDRRLFLVGALLYVGGTGLNLVARFADVRWLLVPAIVLWIVGGIVVLVGAARYVNDRRSR
jgi:hypothetical protein